MLVAIQDAGMSFWSKKSFNYLQKSTKHLLLNACCWARWTFGVNRFGCCSIARNPHLDSFNVSSGEWSKFTVSIVLQYKNPLI